MLFRRHGRQFAQFWKRCERLLPEEHVVEFGIKLNSEAGVVVSRTAAEGHFTVKITWRRDITSVE